MSNANRDYAIVYDIKNSSLVLSRPLVFYITDMNTSNIFVRLVTKVNIGNGVDQYTDIEEASSYALTMKVIKPNNEVKSIEATQHEPESIFQFNLTEDFKDIPGKYICELTISTIVSERQELITSDPFNYEVKRSILSNVSEIIETEDTTVEKLLNNLEASKIRLFNDLELAKTNLHNDLNATSSALNSQVQASNNKIENIKKELSSRLDVTEAELSSQIKDIVSDDNNFILYSFFRDANNPIRNDLYISSDGDTLKRINSQSIADAKDPSIIYKNGWWLIAGTSYNPHDFIVYRSKDLVKWERKNINVGLYNDISNRIWAPEWFEDDNGDLYILLSVKVKEEYDKDNILIPSFRPYIIKVTNVDELEFSSPTILNLEDKNKIDPCMIKENGIYHMFIKDEYDKLTEHWTSSDLKTWTFKRDITELKEYVEGQTIVKHNNTFYLYADSFKGDYGIIYYVTSTDLENWSGRRAVKVGANRVRHGTAYLVKDNKAKQDLQKFMLANSAIPAHNMRSKGFTLNQFANEEGIIENLEIIDKCVYSITNKEHFTINSFTNPNGAKEFYFYISSNDDASITLNTDMSVVGVPTGYSYEAKYGDNDILIKYIFSESIGRFKPVTTSNTVLSKKTTLNEGGWKTITLTSQTISNLDVEDGVVYRVNGNEEVVINGIVDNKKSGTHFYLLLATNGSGSITVNSGNDLTVPNDLYVISKEKGLNDVLIEFIKVNGSTFRLRK